MAYKDWLPGKRSDQLEMARTWVQKLPNSGGVWTVTPAEVTELAVLVDTAQEALDDVAKDKGSQIDNARVREAFAALTRYIRLLRERKFFSPPFRLQPRRLREVSPFPALGLLKS
jgi:hypothetical protein